MEAKPIAFVVLIVSIIIDAVRAAKIALDRGIGGPILSASSYFMKSPPVQYNDTEAKQAVEDFIAGTIER